MSEARDDRARKYREAAEAHFGAGRVEAAGVFRREGAGDPDALQSGLLGMVFQSIFRLQDSLTKGTIGGLPERFLLVVTADTLYAFNCQPSGEVEFGTELASFERDQVWLRRTADGDFIYLYANEKGRTDEIPLEGATEESFGAAEVLAALTKKPANEDAGPSE
jgi:hypothetical protein